MVPCNAELFLSEVELFVILLCIRFSPLIMAPCDVESFLSEVELFVILHVLQLPHFFLSFGMKMHVFVTYNSMLGTNLLGILSVNKNAKKLKA